MRGVMSSDLELERDRFKVWPRWLSHLPFPSTGWGHQGPTWIAIKRPETIHLVHAYFTRILALLAASVTLSPIHGYDVPTRTHRSRDRSPANRARLWSNFLNAIRSPSDPEGYGTGSWLDTRVQPIRNCVKKIWQLPLTVRTCVTLSLISSARTHQPGGTKHCWLLRANDWVHARLTLALRIFQQLDGPDISALRPSARQIFLTQFGHVVSRTAAHDCAWPWDPTPSHPAHRRTQGESLGIQRFKLNREAGKVAGRNRSKPKTSGACSRTSICTRTSTCAIVPCTAWLQRAPAGRREHRGPRIRPGAGLQRSTYPKGALSDQWVVRFS